MVTDNISISTSVNRLRLLILIFIAVNLVFLSGTYYVHWLFSRPDKLSTVLANYPGSFLLSQFNLNSENNLASWYSSSLLLMVALFALACFILAPKTDPNKNRRLASGWLILSVVFGLLSFDEMGSIHENAGKLTSGSSMGNVNLDAIFLVPIFVVVLFLLVFAWLQKRSNVYTFTFIALGTLFFATIPFQQYLEITMWEDVDFAENWNRPIAFVLLEEGIELFASLFFFIAMFFFLMNVNPSRDKTITIELDPAKSLRWFLLFSTAAFAVYFFVLASENLFSEDEGVALNWFPMTSAIIIALLVGTIHRKNNFPALFFCLLLSAYFGANIYAVLNDVDNHAVVWVFQWFVTGGLVWFIFSISYRLPDWKWRTLHILAGLLILPAFIFDHSIVTLPAFIGLQGIAAAQLKYASTS